MCRIWVMMATTRTGGIATREGRVLARLHSTRSHIHEQRADSLHSGVQRVGSVRLTAASAPPAPWWHPLPPSPPPSLPPCPPPLLPPPLPPPPIPEGATDDLGRPRGRSLGGSNAATQAADDAQAAWDVAGDHNDHLADVDGVRRAAPLSQRRARTALLYMRLLLDVENNGAAERNASNWRFRDTGGWRLTDNTLFDLARAPLAAPIFHRGATGCLVLFSGCFTCVGATLKESVSSQYPIAQAMMDRRLCDAHDFLVPKRYCEFYEPIRAALRRGCGDRHVVVAGHSIGATLAQLAHANGDAHESWSFGALNTFVRCPRPLPASASFIIQQDDRIDPIASWRQAFFASARECAAARYLVTNASRADGTRSLSSEILDSNGSLIDYNASTFSSDGEAQLAGGSVLTSTQTSGLSSDGVRETATTSPATLELRGKEQPSRWPRLPSLRQPLDALMRTIATGEDLERVGITNGVGHLVPEYTRLVRPPFEPRSPAPRARPTSRLDLSNAAASHLRAS